MIRKTSTIKINLPGGVITVEELKAILNAAEKARVSELKFGIRQQVYLEIQENYLHEFLQDIKLQKLVFEMNEDALPNIVSGYVTQGIFQNTGWINEKIYKEILAAVNYAPSLKLNIVDNEQSFIPFFTGNINFISSETKDHWFLYIRFPKTSIIYKWKNLVSSKQMMLVARLVEEVILLHQHLFYAQAQVDGDLLFAKVNELATLTNKTAEQGVDIAAFRLPYYEGFNQYGSKLWLGVYRREEWFPLQFLKDLCIVCQQTRVNLIYSTPWKSIIVKDIQLNSRRLWENILGKYRINVRHASNELNWQVADLCEESLNLKRFLIRQFDKDDVRTFGLCFTVMIQNKTGLFGSVIIHKQPNNSANQRRSLDRYDILYTTNFNPNSINYIVYRKDVLKEHLGAYLISVCKFYYEEQLLQATPDIFEAPLPALGQEI